MKANFMQKEKKQATILAQDIVWSILSSQVMK